MYQEQNTKNNLPAQIEIYAEYDALFLHGQGGSANKSYLFQETKALLNPESLKHFLAEKIAKIGTAACPPYHLAIVVGTSAEHALKVAKLASARYLDGMPMEGSLAGHGIRLPEIEEVLKIIMKWEWVHSLEATLLS